MASTKPYMEVVQITDCHLYRDPSAGLYGINSRQGLEQVVALAAARQPDWVLLTGDIVHDETREGYEALGGLLAPLRAPVACIPGNHDDMALMKSVLHCDNPPAHQCDNFILGDHWQIIMLNSQWPGEVAGRLTGKELQFLEQQLQQHPDKHTMICMHHHPVEIGSRWLDTIGLKNADEFFAITDKHAQVQAILWGHIHQDFDCTQQDYRLLATPSTCIQFTPGADDFDLDDIAPGYRWLRLYDDGRLETGVERLADMPGCLDIKASGY